MGEQSKASVLTLIVNAEVVAVEPEPIFAVRMLQPVEDAGMYMC